MHRSGSGDRGYHFYRTPRRCGYHFIRVSLSARVREAFKSEQVVPKSNGYQRYHF